MCWKRKETRQDGVFLHIQNGAVFQCLEIFFCTIIYKQHSHTLKVLDKRFLPNNKFLKARPSYGFRNAGARKSLLDKHLVVTEHLINIFIETILKNEHILRISEY